MNLKSLLCSGAVVLTAWQLFAADIPKAPVPPSPFIRIVYGYADAMLKSGRDKDGLFLSALDRNTLAPLTNRPAAPEGVRESDRVGASGGPLVGSNPYHDENLLRLLSTLTDLSGKPHYRAAADAELKWFVASANPAASEPFRPWMLWDRCFKLEPDASRRSLVGLTQERTNGPLRLQRVDGFKLRALAVAYAHTRDDRFTRAISASFEPSVEVWADCLPSLAIDINGAAHRVPEPLSSRLRALSANIDESLCGSTNGIKRTGRFVNELPRATHIKPRPPTSLWKASFDSRTTAQVGMMCVSRYDNSGNVQYRDLVFAAADAYLDSLPTVNDDAWPGTFGHAISLQLAAWRHSANWKYMERARRFGDIAVEKFWGTNALPKASYKADHYETVTGADTLALALLELHLQILHITAVRCPPNTIDR